MVDTGGRLELFEAKWTELPDTGDTVNLDFVRNVVGKSRVAAGAVVCPRTERLCACEWISGATDDRTEMNFPDGVTGNSAIPGIVE